MDTLTSAQRSGLMSRVKAKNTKPELMVRRLLHSMGFRYRLHGQLPGRPDIVFRSRRKVIFVHGCFWHRHPGCPKTTRPTANAAFWASKFRANRLRDKRIERELTGEGWSVIVVWECELKDLKALKRRLRRELGRMR